MFVGLVTEFYNENMKQRELSSTKNKEIPLLDRIKRNFNQVKSYFSTTENKISLEVAIDYLAYKTKAKLSQQEFLDELNQMGVSPSDFSQAYHDYRNKRRLRDLHGLENGDISTLYSLFEDKMDQYLNSRNSGRRDSINRIDVVQ